MKNRSESISRRVTDTVHALIMNRLQGTPAYERLFCELFNPFERIKNPIIRAHRRALEEKHNDPGTR